ncbi:MAG TPA: RNA-binding cell elongation regulator Jag/EloR [Egibacteraceae bacterium]|nr:RNA-binding cell elongation regulator Jag/EloR [Egibacteraceae bacterium]
MTRSAEGQGATVDEAVRRALADLGLSEEEATVEVLAEGRRGLFGGGRRAHVRVTARPVTDEHHPPQAAAEAARSDETRDEEDGVAQSDTETTQSADGPDDPRTDGATAGHAEDAGDAAGGREGGGAGEVERELTPQERMDQLDEEAELAADFVEGLLDRFDLPGDLEIEVHEDQAFVNLQDVDSGILIGRRGATLDALQELVRSAVQRQTERRAHVRIDVEGYKARQTEKLRDKCREAIAQVRETGEPFRLEPMDAYERKLMHNLVAKTGGVTSVSEGHEPKRRVVIHPET